MIIIIMIFVRIIIMIFVRIIIMIFVRVITIIMNIIVMFLSSPLHYHHNYKVTLTKIFSSKSEEFFFRKIFPYFCKLELFVKCKVSRKIKKTPALQLQDVIIKKYYIVLIIHTLTLLKESAKEIIKIPKRDTFGSV